MLVLAAFASGYGYHRDELYFLAAGKHLAWGYPDQGPVTPLIARLMSDLSLTSLTVLRLPSAFMAGAVVLLTGLIARELGGPPRAQLLASATASTGVIVLYDGHLLSTSTVDLLVWTLTSWLVIRAVISGRERWWLLAGVTLGVGLLDKPLPAFLLLALAVGVMIAGPRRLLRARAVWAALAIALLIWAPWLAWQARHGWPQIEVSRSISSGNSASSQPWWAVVPFQVLLLGPPLAAVWIVGLRQLLVSPELRQVRFVGWAWMVLALMFTLSAGKPYYMAGLLPVLTAAGALAADRGLERGRRRTRRAALATVVMISAAIGATIALPVLPVDSAGPVFAANADVAETIGWPQLAVTVANVRDRLPAQPRPVIFTRNYGEAGAIDRFGPALGLPHAFSGHNAFSEWGPPSNRAAPVIVVGLSSDDTRRFFRGCSPAARIGTPADVDNEEHGKNIDVCSGPRRKWSTQWSAMRHFN